MEIEGISFYEALKSLAERYGIPMPKRSQYADEDSRSRSPLHHARAGPGAVSAPISTAPAGEAARTYLARRGVSRETIEQFGLGYSDRSGRALLRLLEQRGFTAAQMEQSGLVGKREDGSIYDRFRNRLMFPIHNEAGKIIGFGGRALAAEDNPKYLNSPETPIYKKSYVLYNLHRAKEAIRKEDRVILVEGYMDAIGVTAAGFGPVVASCGTSLTSQQVQMLKRHSQTDRRQLRSRRARAPMRPSAPSTCCWKRACRCASWSSTAISIPTSTARSAAPQAYAERLDARQRLLLLAGRPRPREARCAHHGRPGGGAEIADAGGPEHLRPDGAHGCGERRRRLSRRRSRHGARRVQKAVAERSDQGIPAAQGSRCVHDERMLLNVLLAEPEVREEIVPELQLVRGASGRSRRAASSRPSSALSESGGRSRFEEVNARLEEADQDLLARGRAARRHAGRRGGSDGGGLRACGAPKSSGNGGIEDRGSRNRNAPVTGTKRSA